MLSLACPILHALSALFTNVGRKGLVPVYSYTPLLPKMQSLSIKFYKFDHFSHDPLRDYWMTDTIFFIGLNL